MTADAMVREAADDLGLGEPNYIQKWYARRNGSAYDYNFPWCDAFMTNSAYHSGNYDAVCPRGDRAYTPYHAQDGEYLGFYFPGTSTNIKKYLRRGAIVFMDWSGSNRIWGIDHVGVAVRNLGDGRVETIEGNTSDQCLRRVRGASVIAGFWNPDYSRTGAPPKKADDGILRQGMQSNAVRKWQANLQQWNPDALPEFGADGDFGKETVAWTKKFQRDVGITVDGEVGPNTREAMEKELEDVAAEDVWKHEWEYHGTGPLQASTILSRTYVHTKDLVKSNRELVQSNQDMQQTMSEMADTQAKLLDAVAGITQDPDWQRLKTEYSKALSSLKLRVQVVPASELEE